MCGVPSFLAAYAAGLAFVLGAATPFAACAVFFLRTPRRRWGGGR
ncbi:MAG: hypothetical protein ACK41C_10370 [Phenylobacterium sp.]